ncbi:alpha-xylosidase [Apiospora arundinis]
MGGSSEQQPRSKKAKTGGAPGEDSAMDMDDEAGGQSILPDLKAVKSMPTQDTQPIGSDPSAFKIYRNKIGDYTSITHLDRDRFILIRQETALSDVNVSHISERKT